MQNILIIEDEKRIAHWVKTYFERAGYSAEVAHDGKVGLALARETVSYTHLTLPTKA